MKRGRNPLFSPRWTRFRTLTKTHFCPSLRGWKLFSLWLRNRTGTGNRNRRKRFSRNRSGTGTAGTVFQEPKPEQEPSFLLHCTETQKKPFSRRTARTKNQNRSNRSTPKPQPSRTEPRPPCLSGRHRIASVFALCERIAEDFRSENAHRQDFYIASHRHSVFTTHHRSHRIAARIARYGPLSSLLFSKKGPEAAPAKDRIT